jgi:hypothetical protein
VRLARAAVADRDHVFRGAQCIRSGRAAEPMPC